MNQQNASKSHLQSINNNLYRDLEAQKKLTGLAEQQKQQLLNDYNQQNIQMKELKQNFQNQQNLLKRMKEEFQMFKSESEMRIEELQKIVNQQSQDLIDYKETKKQLFDKSFKVEGLINNNNELKDTVQVLNEQILQQKDGLLNKEDQIDSLKREIKDLKQLHDKNIKDLEKSSNEENQRINKQMNEIKENLEEKIKKMTTEYQENIKNKDNEILNTKERAKKQEEDSSTMYRNLTKNIQAQTQQLKDIMKKEKDQMQQELDSERLLIINLKENIVKLSQEITDEKAFFKKYENSLIEYIKVANLFKIRIEETDLKKLNPVHGKLLNYHQLIKLSDCKKHIYS